MYYEAEGVKQDYAKAIKWLQKAAEQRDAESQFILGSIYYEGKIVKQDYNKALEWLEKAARNGHVKAQKTLYFLNNSKK